MNLINDLRELAEDLHANGYNRYSAAMSKAADELAKWEAVFGHLGDTPDECGNSIIAARDELEERCATLTDALTDAQPDGWKLVPIEPTEEMIIHLIDVRLDALVAGKEHTFVDIYKEMLAVAPKPKRGRERLRNRIRPLGENYKK